MQYKRLAALLRFGIIAVLLTELSRAQAENFVWQRKALETYGNAGKGISMAITTDALPAVAYYAQQGSKMVLRYGEQTAAGWKFEMVEEVDGELTNTSLAFYGGPFISYQNHGHLKFARKNGAAWEISDVDPASGSGRHCSILIQPITGRPMIAYEGVTTGGLARVRCAVPITDSSWALEDVAAEPGLRQVRLGNLNPSGAGEIIYLNSTGETRQKVRAGSSWTGSNEVISSSTLTISDYTMYETITIEDRAFAAIVKRPGGGVDVVLKRLITAPWTSELVASFPAADQNIGSIALSRQDTAALFSGNFFLAFTLREGGEDRIYYTTRGGNPGDPWSTPVVIGKFDQLSSEHEVAVPAGYRYPNNSFDFGIPIGLHNAHWDDAEMLAPGPEIEMRGLSFPGYANGLSMAMHGNQPRFASIDFGDHALYERVLQSPQNMLTTDRRIPEPESQSRYEFIYPGGLVIDDLGRSHVAALTTPTGPAGLEGLVYAHRDDADTTWVVERVPAGTSIPLGPAKLFMRRGQGMDQPRLVRAPVNSDQAIRIYYRNSPGPFQTDSLTTSSLNEAFDSIQLLFGRLGIFFSTYNNADTTPTLRVYYQEWDEKLSWIGAPLLIDTIVPANPGGVQPFVRTPAGLPKSPCVIYGIHDGGNDSALWYQYRNLDGAWQKIALPPNGFVPAAALHASNFAEPRIARMAQAGSPPDLSFSDYRAAAMQWDGSTTAGQNNTMSVYQMISTNRDMALLTQSGGAGLILAVRYPRDPMVQATEFDLDTFGIGAAAAPAPKNTYYQLRSLFNSSSAWDYFSKLFMQHRQKMLDAVLQDPVLRAECLRVAANLQPNFEELAKGKGSTILLTAGQMEQARQAAFHIRDKVDGVTALAINVFLATNNGLHDFENRTIQEVAQSMGFSIFGNVQVNVNKTSATWTLDTGNSITLTGTGSKTQNVSSPKGQVKITWNPLAGHHAPEPNPEQRALGAGQTITFRGIYVDFLMRSIENYLLGKEGSTPEMDVNNDQKIDIGDLVRRVNTQDH